MNDERFSLIRSGYDVRRLHTIPVVLVPETVGHHTAGVLSIIFYICGDNDPSMNLVKAALEHDVCEAITGDIPATAKWDFPNLKQALDEAEVEIIDAAGGHLALDPMEERLLKFADMFDLYLKARQELHAGNRFFAPILSRAWEVCFSLSIQLRGFPRAAYLLDHHQPEFTDERP